MTKNERKAANKEARKHLEWGWLTKRRWKKHPDLVGVHKAGMYQRDPGGWHSPKPLGSSYFKKFLRSIRYRQPK